MKSILISSSSDIPINYTGHVKYSDGTQKWYKNGKVHREDGPAVIYSNGTQYWYKNGEFHREDGPTVIHVDGKQYWYLNDKKYSRDNYYRELYKQGKITKTELFIELL